MVIGVGQDQNDDTTAVANIYSPLGYGVRLTQAPGTRIGDLEAIFLVGALGGRAWSSRAPSRPGTRRVVNATSTPAAKASGTRPSG